MRALRWNSLEVLAVISSLLYTILLSYESIWSWLFAILASIFFSILCFRRKIYAELALQGFYFATAVYGYLNWGAEFKTLPPLDLNIHLYIIAASILLIGISGYALSHFTDSKLPYLDSFTTISSIAATILMVNFYPENWIYWIVIDTVSIWLYYQRGLKLSALLFLIYTLLSINGYLLWSGALS